jgi:hypothetical protein
MTNHTNTNSNTGYDETDIIFVCLIIFMGFCSISCMIIQLCFGSNSICNDINRYIKRRCQRLYEDREEFEYEINYDSDSEIEDVVKPIEEVGIKKVKTFANVNHYPVYCSICQEEQTNTVKIDCGHNFCKECIMGYIKVGRECPNCREGIKNIYEVEVLVFK